MTEQHVEKTRKTLGKGIVYYLLAISCLDPESHKKIDRLSQKTIKLEQSGLTVSCCEVPLSEHTDKVWQLSSRLPKIYEKTNVFLDPCKIALGCFLHSFQGASVTNCYKYRRKRVFHNARILHYKIRENMTPGHKTTIFYDKIVIVCIYQLWPYPWNKKTL